MQDDLDDLEDIQDDITLDNIGPVRLKFHGIFEDYFKIWIVNVLLSIATLGIYSAWAKVRNKKYLYASTEFAGARFDYHAKPMQILLGRIVAWFIFGVVGFGLNLINPALTPFAILLFVGLFPYLLVRSLKFNAAHTSYRNIRFRFMGKTSWAYALCLKYLAFPTFLNIIVIGTAFYLEYVKKNGEIFDLSSIGLTLENLPLIMGGSQIVLVLYSLLMASRILNAMFSFVYNNLYLGKTKVSLNTDYKMVSKKIIRPYFGYTFLAIAGMVVFALGIGFLTSLAKFAAVLFVPLFIIFYASIIIISLYFPYLVIDYIWNRIEFNGGRSYSDLKFKDFLLTSFINMLIVGVTMGILYPFARIRILQLKIDTKSIEVKDLDNITGHTREEISSIGDEIGEALDFDIEIGM